MSLGQTIRFIWDHPLTRQDRLRALTRYVRWQVGSRVAPGPVVVPFVGDTVLVVEPGMSGATGNVYVGLHEVDEMGFVLHWLRAGDRFADVGANVGGYSVLAAGAAGAEVVAFEPVPATHQRLLRNIAINRLGDRVDARLNGVGAAAERLTFTADGDAANHALAPGEVAAGPTCEVEVVTLDQVLGDAPPALVKIDVEGLEERVLAGAAGILADPRLQAVVIARPEPRLQPGRAHRDPRLERPAPGPIRCRRAPPRADRSRALAPGERHPRQGPRVRPRARPERAALPRPRRHPLSGGPATSKRPNVAARP